MIATQSEELNRSLGGGLPDGGVMLIHGRPGTGKTMFLNGMAIQVCRQGISPSFVSLELGMEGSFLHVAPGAGIRIYKTLSDEAMYGARIVFVDDFEMMLESRHLVEMARRHDVIMVAASNRPVSQMGSYYADVVIGLSKDQGVIKGKILKNRMGMVGDTVELIPRPELRMSQYMIRPGCDSGHVMQWDFGKMTWEEIGKSSDEFLRVKEKASRDFEKLREEAVRTGKAVVTAVQKRKPPEFVPEVEVVIKAEDIDPNKVKHRLKAEWSFSKDGGVEKASEQEEEKPEPDHTGETYNPYTGKWGFL